jgi:hypothetical protein
MTGIRLGEGPFIMQLEQAYPDTCGWLSVDELQKADLMNVPQRPTFLRRLACRWLRLVPVEVYRQLYDRFKELRPDA